MRPINPKPNEKRLKKKKIGPKMQKRRVDFHEHAHTADSAVASGKYGIWSVPTTESAVPSLVSMLSRRLLPKKLIKLSIYHRVGGPHFIPTAESAFITGRFVEVSI